MNYIPLNIKTHYELLSSLIKIDDLISYALKNNIKSLGITDSNMFSCIEFYNKCISNDIKPIIGIEVTIDNDSFLLYARNYEGYVNLCNIVSTKNINSLNYEYLKDKKDNLICVSPIELYNKLSNIYDDLYISYSNNSERTEALIISKNIVFIKKGLTLYEEDNEYIKYLYMIRDTKTIEDKLLYDTNNHIDFNIDAIDVKSTLKFNELIDIIFPKFEIELPKYSNNSNELFKSLCKKGLLKRIGKPIKKYVDRLIYEIEVIEKMGFIDYFLIVYDFVLFAKKNKIQVRCRGSAAGSLVSYVLGITDIDPIKFDLIFERFLNPERVTMPDIDIDLADIKRDVVIDYVKNKYGIDKTAHIITFGTLLSKQVIRDVGRVLNIDVSEIDNIVKFIKDKDTFKDLEKNKNFINYIKSDIRYVKLIEISKKLENLKRHTSIHAAGIVISNNLLMNKIPLYKSGDDILTGYSMNYLEDLGLLKIDFLGVTNLTVIDNVINLIKEETDIEINLNNITLKDSMTLELFRNVNTVGIFQFESSGMKSFLKALKINSFDDLVVAIALYRPGPMAMIPTYIKRKEGKEKINYILPELEPILKSTYGIIIYQEQILEILKVIGGYSYSQADIIRRAISKKKEDVILKEREKFIASSIKNGFKEEAAIEIFDLIEKFADYGFNKSHSVAYSIVGYQMAYLKSHYKEYFMTHLLNMHIGRENKTKEYTDESKILGLEFENININISSNKFIYKNKKIVYPLTIIKGLGDTIAKDIIEERNKRVFKDIFDFFARCNINRNVLESLTYVGAFDCFNINKKTIIENLDNLIDYSNLCKSLDVSLVLKPELEKYSEFNDSEILENEYKSLGFYMTNHPVTKYKRELTLENIEKYFDKNINIILLVEQVKIINTKNKEKMAFFTASDEFKKIELILFPRIYEKYNNIIKGNIIKLNGKVEKRLDTYQIILNSLDLLK